MRKIMDIFGLMIISILFLTACGNNSGEKVISDSEYDISDRNEQNVDIKSKHEKSFDNQVQEKLSVEQVQEERKKIAKWGDGFVFLYHDNIYGTGWRWFKNCENCGKIIKVCAGNDIVAFLSQDGEVITNMGLNISENYGKIIDIDIYDEKIRLLSEDGYIIAYSGDVMHEEADEFGFVAVDYKVYNFSKEMNYGVAPDFVVQVDGAKRIYCLNDSKSSKDSIYVIDNIGNVTKIRYGYNDNFEMDTFIEKNYNDWQDIAKISIGFSYGNLFVIGLKTDGSVCASGEGYNPEILKWKDIVDIYVHGANILGMKSDGTFCFTDNTFFFTNEDIDGFEYLQENLWSKCDSVVNYLFSSGGDFVFVCADDIAYIRGLYGGKYVYYWNGNGYEKLEAKEISADDPTLIERQGYWYLVSLDLNEYQQFNEGSVFK